MRNGKATGGWYEHGLWGMGCGFVGGPQGTGRTVGEGCGVAERMEATEPVLWGGGHLHTGLSPPLRAGHGRTGDPSTSTQTLAT